MANIGNVFYGHAPLTNTKFDWWDLSGVTTLNADTFQGCWRVSGTLSLPKMRNLTGAPLRNLTNTVGLVVGGYDASTTVLNIPANAFSGDTSLRRLTLHADSGIAVGATPFSDARTPDEIRFTGAPPDDASVLANLLDGVGAGDAPVFIRVPAATRQWRRAVGIDHLPTTAEKSLAGDERRRVFGVCRGEAGGASFIKALCVSDVDLPDEATVFVLR